MKTLNFSFFFILVIAFSVNLRSQNVEQLYKQSCDYYKQGNYSMAITYGEKLLKETKKEYGKSDVAYARCLALLASYHQLNKDYEKAEELFIQSIDLKKSLLGENDTEYLTTLNNLAIFYFTSSNYLKSEQSQIKLLEIRKKVLGESHPDFATSLEDLAFIYYKIHNYEKAAPLYEKALAIRLNLYKVTDPEYQRPLNMLAYIYKELGQFEKAKIKYEKAIEINYKVFGETSPVYLTSMTNLAVVCHDMGIYNQAEEICRKVLKIKKESIGEAHRDYALSLNNLASMYEDRGEYEKAEPLYLNSLEIKKNDSGETSLDYSISLNNLASLYFHIGNYYKAESLNIVALEIRRKVLGENHIEYAVSLSNLAQIYHTLGNYKKAETFYINAFDIIKSNKADNNINYTIALDNLAGIYATIGSYDKAEKAYYEVLEFKKINLIYGENPYEYAISLNNLADLYESKGEYDKAETIFLEAVEICKKALSTKSFGYATVLSNLGKCYLDKMDYNKAEELFQDALGIYTETLGENHPYCFTVYNNLTFLYAESNKFEKSLQYNLKSITVANQEIQDQFAFLSETEKGSFLKTINVGFDNINILSIKQNKSNPSISIYVYNNLLKTKGLLLKSSSSMRNAVLSSNDTNLIATYDKWNSLKKQIAKIYNLPIEKRFTDLPRFESEANDLEKELTRGSSVLSDFNSSLSFTWKDIQSQLKQNEAAIEFTNFRYNKDSVLYCALILKKDSQYPEMVQLFEEKQLSEFLGNSTENNIHTVNAIYGTKAYPETELYNLIWKPLEPFLKGIQTVNFSPSGLLNKISFAAISDRIDHLLIDDYKLNILSSTAIITKPTQSSFDKNTNVSLFGGIDYSIKDTTYSPWNYLEGTLSETDQLNTTFAKQGIKVNYIKAKAATKQEFKTLAANSNILHVATHGFFFPEPEKMITEEDNNEVNKDIVSRSASRSVMLNYIRNDNSLMRSGLVFAGVNDYWNGISDDVDNNGILTALDVVNIDLRKSKLVVLSACETGLGDIKDGEGVYGLQRAFKMAGAENIIMSLWKVPDQETAEFMNTFYGLLFKEGNINQAFTETQSIMRNKYDPYYWAAFVLMK